MGVWLGKCERWCVLWGISETEKFASSHFLSLFVMPTFLILYLSTFPFSFSQHNSNHRYLLEWIAYESKLCRKINQRPSANFLICIANWSAVDFLHHKQSTYKDLCFQLLCPSFVLYTASIWTNQFEIWLGDDSSLVTLLVVYYEQGLGAAQYKRLSKSTF